MRHSFRSQCGQLLLPILGLMFMFGVFLVGFLKWSQAVYWQMRTDMIAEAVAISAARAQAEMLNDLAVLQTAENAFLQQVEFGSVNIGHVQAAYAQEFKTTNAVLIAALRGFNGQTMAAAQAVARANRIKIPAVPYPKPDHHLEPQKVNILYVAELVPMGEELMDKAYFLRSWGPGKLHAQPDHQVSWGVSDHGTMGTASATVWFDVDPGNWLNNGGFPGKDLSWERNIAIQCFFPQFNARLISTPADRDLLLRAGFKALSS